MGGRILKLPTWVRLALLGCVAALGACEKKAPTPPEDTGASVSAPVQAAQEAVDATDSTQPGSPDASADWTPLNTQGLHYVALKGGYFNSNGSVKREQPRVVVIAYPESEAQKSFTKTHEESSKVVSLGEAQLRELGFEPPEAVWLFGEEGPCRAKVGDGYATVEYEINPILERGYFVEACADDYAPVAWVGAQPPELRWHHAAYDFDEIVEDPQGLQHPAREQFVELGLLDNIDPDTNRKAVTHVRVLQAGPVAEFGVMQHWPHPEDCEESEAGGVQTALWDGVGPPKWLDAGDRFSSPELMGALTLDGNLAAVVYDERFHMYIQTQDDYIEFLTGDYHDEDIAFWGWSVLDGYCGP